MQAGLCKPRQACRAEGKVTESDQQNQIKENQEQWTKDDGTYIPHPATWLNQECWEDEVKGGYSQKESDRDIDWSKVELPIINP